MCSWQEGALFSLSLSRSSQPSRFKFLVHVHRWKKERKLTRFFLFRRRRRRGRRVASEGRIGRGRRRRRRKRREEEREGKEGGGGTRNIERRKIHPRSPRRKRIKRGRWVIVVGASFHWESWEIPAIWCRRTPCPRYVIDDRSRSRFVSLAVSFLRSRSFPLSDIWSRQPKGELLVGFLSRRIKTLEDNLEMKVGREIWWKNRLRQSDDL